ncbi:hypothetical protein [Roseivirga spongicola]|uniref:hypothetical protein n=1 Tax=Roseivirga spongicola TaxID=333140 RepID=UPI002AC92192|nr:hypothetical protein [Roseivirga spongicola]WPZ08766.1 hypothetical protein T7867_10905 [Roseivirga spongicola]
MNLSIMLQNTAPGVSETLLEKGIMGVFILVLIGFIYILWKSKEKRDDYIREQAKIVNDILGNLANTVDNVYRVTENMPSNVKEVINENIAPKLEDIKDGIKELKHLKSQP